MRAETEKLRKLNVLTIQILDEAGLLPENVKVTKDEAGTHTGGLTYQLSGRAQSESRARGSMDVEYKETPTQEDGPRQE